MTNQTLKINNLTCVRGGREIFKNISFELVAGEALQITGLNGSGKTSLLRIIAGLIQFPSGQVSFTDCVNDSKISQFCHYLGHTDAIKPTLTVSENLNFWRSIMGNQAETVTDSLKVLGLSHLENISASYLSAGQQRRLSLARLLVNKRPIWLLDEPLTSLDLNAINILNEIMLTHVTNGGLILAATHSPLKLINSKELKLSAVK